MAFRRWLAGGLPHCLVALFSFVLGTFADYDLRPASPSRLCHRYPFTDDTCPPLESVVDFCENAKAWLDAHEDNVVSLHCKAGKGRAGIMAACLMVRMGETAHRAVESFDAVRRGGGQVVLCA